MKKNAECQSKSLLARITPFLAVLLFLTSTHNSSAQTKKEYRPAKETDPEEIGWKPGLPPVDSLFLSVSDDSFFTSPKMRYSLCHMRQFLPTVNVSRELNPPTLFKYTVDKQINNITFKLWGADTTMTWEQSLRKNYRDSMTILHDVTLDPQPII